MASVRHYHHHYRFSYETSLKKHFSLTVLVTMALVGLFLVLFHFIYPSRQLIQTNQITAGDLLQASIATLWRLTIAYLLSVVLAVPLALLITKNARFERILLPVFDIIQSVPVLAFFPVIVLIFVKVNFFDGAAIFVIFMAMLWNIVFSMIGGLKTIPADIEAVSFVFKSKGLRKLISITLPAVLPYIITGSLLAWGQGWNILIVAEVLHNYIPGGNPSQDLYGLGSLLVNASYRGQSFVFLCALIAMIILIGFMNFFIWQRLLRAAERYKFD